MVIRIKHETKTEENKYSRHRLICLLSAANVGNIFITHKPCREKKWYAYLKSQKTFYHGGFINTYQSVVSEYGDSQIPVYATSD
jgi:hypothetical protein